MIAQLARSSVAGCLAIVVVIAFGTTGKNIRNMIRTDFVIQPATRQPTSNNITSRKNLYKPLTNLQLMYNFPVSIEKQLESKTLHIELKL
jgi:hypothetical protein